MRDVGEMFQQESRRRIVLRQGRERSLLNRHPWVFSGAVATDEGPMDAAVADVFASDGRHLASGFYSAKSQIRVRAVAFGQELTPDLIVDRIHQAAAHREHLRLGGTNAFRMIHSEGDQLSGLIVDRYDEALVVEITSAGLDRLRDLVLGTLRSLSPEPGSVVVKNDLPARKLEGLSQLDEGISEAAEIGILENGLRFFVTPGKGQKTGFFLDQRPNRLLARELAKGRRVLNVFSYSGGFGVNAAAGGALSIEEVDTSEEALELARRNHQANQSEASVIFSGADAFQHLRTLGKEGRTYDLIIVDPPAFARSRGEVDRAARGYKDINLQAFRLLSPGGLLMTFSCSGHLDADLFQKIIFSAALDARREASILRRLGAGEDHPVSLYCPESEYLKGLLVGVA